MLSQILRARDTWEEKDPEAKGRVSFARSLDKKGANFESSSESIGRKHIGLVPLYVYHPFSFPAMSKAILAMPPRHTRLLVTLMRGARDTDA